MRRLRILAALAAAALPLCLLASSGFIASNGSDLDSVFAPYHTGWPQAAATGYVTSDGHDLNARYAPLSTGSAAAATGFRLSSGADLNTVFAALGSTGVQVATQPSSVSGSAAAGNPSGTVTSGSTSCAGTKGSGSYSYTWTFASGSGAAFTSGSSSSTAVTGTVSAGSTNSGTMYCSVSDGVTSANSNTVSWSLTNTTPAYIYVGTLIAGEEATGSPPSIGIGYVQNLIGSLSGSGSLTSTGHTITALEDTSTNGSQPLGSISINGFTSQPSASFFSALIINGVSFPTSSASVSYLNGIATWGWGTAFNLGNGQTYTIDIAP